MTGQTRQLEAAFAREFGVVRETLYEYLRTDVGTALPAVDPI